MALAHWKNVLIVPTYKKAGLITVRGVQARLKNYSGRTPMSIVGKCLHMY